MAKVRNTETGKVEDVGDYASAIRNRTHVPVPDAEYLVRNGAGQLKSIAGSDVQGAINKGYQLLSDEQGVQAARKEKFGDSELAAGAAGAARGLTFGLSDLALTKSGAVDADTLAGLREFNPISGGVGEVAGAALPTLLSGGAALVAKGGAKAALANLPTGVLSRATQAAAGGIETGLSGLANRAVARGIGAGVGSALEGAAYGIGAEITEASLGDYELTAQSLLASAGMGAMLGGAVGGATGAISGGLAQRAASRAERSAADRAAQAERNAAEQAADIASTPPPVIREGVGDAAAAAEARLDDAANFSPRDPRGNLDEAAAPLAGPNVSRETSAENIVDRAPPPRSQAEQAEALAQLYTASTGNRAPDGLGETLLGAMKQSKVGEAAAETAAAATGVDKDALQSLLLTAEGRNAAVAGAQAKQVYTRQTTGALDRMYQVMDEVMDASRGEAKKNVMRAAVPDDYATLNKAYNTAQKALSDTNIALGDMLARPHAYGGLAQVENLQGKLKFFEAELSEVVSDDLAQKAGRINGMMDDFKRTIGKAAKFGTAGSAEAGATAGRLKDLYESAWMLPLEKAEVWGEKAAKAQIEMNAAWNRHLQRASNVEREFFREVGTGRDAKILRANPSYIDGYMGKLGNANNDLSESQLAYYMASGQDFLAAAEKHMDLPDALKAKVAEARKAITQVNDAKGKMTNQIVMANALAQLRATSPWAARGVNTMIGMERVKNAIVKGLDDGFGAVLRQSEKNADRQARATTGAARYVADRVDEGTERQVRATTGAARYVADRAEDTAERSTRATLAQGRSTGEAIVGAVRATGRAGRQVVEEQGAAQAGQSRSAARVDRLRSTAVYGAEKAFFGSLPEAGPEAPSERGRDAQSALFRRQAARLQQVANSPGLLADRIAQNTGDLSLHAPNTVAALQTTTARGVQFLQDKLPKSPQAQLPPALQRPWSPSDEQLAKFSRYSRAVAQPMSVIEDLKEGRLTREAVEAVQAVHPALYGLMVERLTDAIASAEKPVGYAQKVQLSLLMGVPLDVSLTPAYLGMVGQAQATPGPQPGPGQAPARGPRVGGIDKMERAERNESSLERIARSA